jgi:signal transduction histidine kinase
MEIVHDFSPEGDADPVRGRLDQLELQLDLYQKALGHDLPNQMVALQGLTRMLELELGPEEPQDVRDLTTRLAALARQADETMRSLAALGRLGRQREATERVDLGELVREAATEAKVLFKHRAVEYHFHDAFPVAVTKRAPLYQVLAQLLRNAFQAAAPARTLIIEIRGRRLEAGGIEFQVRDNGRGMNELQLNQVRATLAGRPGGGAGLGLMLVRQVVAGWRGAARIRSEVDNGTAVTILARTL